MAVVTIKSTAITNADAVPSVINNSKLERARLLECVGVLETNDDDSIASVYRFCRVRSGDRVSQVLLSCDAITSGAGDIGLHDIDEGAVVDADLFASAQSIASALANSDVTHESGVYGIEDSEKAVWEVLGLSEDPFKEYDLTMTLTAATTAAGTIAMKVRLAPGP